jgi:uncharacterized protein
MQFIPVVERKIDQGLALASLTNMSDSTLTEWSVIPDEYGKFMIAVFDEWVQKDVGSYFVQLFDATLASWIGEKPGICVFDETCGNALVMEHNGDLYSCDHFVFPGYHLGNIMETPMISMVYSQYQNRFGQNKLTTLPKYCVDCEYRFACQGECPRHRFCNTPEGEPGLSYLCPAYKSFFAHVHPYMQFMADELAKKLPPANVMKWAQTIENLKTEK